MYSTIIIVAITILFSIVYCCCCKKRNLTSFEEKMQFYNKMSLQEEGERMQRSYKLARRYRESMV